MNHPATATAIAASVRAGTSKAGDVVTASLGRIRQRDETLNCFTDALEESALRDAQRVDELLAAGRDPGPLAGVPFAVKNLFDVAGLPTLAGSRIEPEHRVPTTDAWAVTQLRRAGAILVGTTNMDEYAHGFTTENSHYGTTRNPHDLGRIAGGSSGGSAAAVAADLVPLSLGSDTNGSIRVPASLCGVFGLKPTFGRVPRTGSVLFVTSLDHVGPLARSTADLATAFDALQGHDPGDPVSADQPTRPSAPLLGHGVQDLRIAVAGGHFKRVADAEAAEVVERVAAALGSSHEVTIPGSRTACAAAAIITAAEGGQRHAANLRARSQDFDPKVRAGLIAGLLLPASAYLKAQRFRAFYRDQLRTVFADTDVLVTATTPCSAPLIGQERMTVDGDELLVGMSLGLLTQPWALAGLPALSVPVTRSGQLPLGVQLVAAPWNETLLFRVAAALEAQGVLSTQAVPAVA